MNYLCKGEKYTYNEERDLIGLPVECTGLPEEVVVEDQRLFRKSRFHVSLVCIKNLIERYKVDVPNFSEKVRELFCEFVKECPVELARYTDEFRLVQDEDRTTIVAMCEMRGLDAFFDTLNQKCNLTLPHQPAHVTLYTNPKDKGIFLIDEGDIERLTRVTEQPKGLHWG